MFFIIQVSVKFKISLLTNLVIHL